MTIDVLLVDDEELVCRYLTAILQPVPDITVVGVEHDGAGAVDAAIRLQPDVILLDLRMPGIDGMVALERIRQRAPASAVIVLTIFDDDASLLRAMRAGARGFLLKSTAPADLANLIRVAAQGQTVLSPAVARRLVTATADDEAGERARTLIGTLTRRESDVLELLSRGRSNAEIGRLLELTEATVKGYVSRILTKLRCDNRTQAGLLAQTARKSTR
ncbi:MAG: response regulator transcription factor [Nakamurella sp.]